jgi:hypothetical protein
MEGDLAFLYTIEERQRPLLPELNILIKDEKINGLSAFFGVLVGQ